MIRSLRSRGGGFKICFNGKMLMATSIVFGLGIGAALNGPRQAQAVGSPFAATVAPFARDRVVFDSGAALGENATTVALPTITTTAPDGMSIEARAVRADTGAEVYGWRIVGQASGGALAGATLTEASGARTPHWLKVQVRVENSPASAGETANRFGVGHVVALWGQSEIDNLLADFYDGATPDSITADDMVSFHWHDRNPAGTGAAGVVHHHITDAAPHNTRLAAMANSLIEARPGEKFSVILQVKSGSGFEDLLRDGFGNRVWSDDEALHDAATGGGDVGLVAFDWYAAPRTYTTAYGEVLHQIAFGKTVAGASIGAAPVLVGGRFTTDHLLTELYDWSRTRLAVLEPHRFEPTNAGNIALCRTSVRAMYAASAETALVGPGHPVLHYGNGRGDGAGGWTDITHPSPGEGSERFGVGLVQSAIRAMGLTSWTPPAIDNVAWQPDGSYVEIWSSAGPILVNTGTPVGAFIDGQPAPATIVAGRIRVTAADVGAGTPFVSSTTLAFAPDSTGLTDAADIQTGWDSYPLVDLSAPGMPDGVPVASAPTLDLSSTIVGASTFAVGSDTRLQDAANHAATTTPYTIKVRANITANTGADMLARDNGNGFTVELLSNGDIRTGVSGAYASRITSSAWSLNAMADFVITMDPATGDFRVFVDGMQVLAESGTPWTWNTSRQLRLLGDTNGISGEVESVTVWKAHTATGADPAGTPYKLIAGTEASAVTTSRTAPVWYFVKNGSVQ
ncbi:hypothetical protein DKT77_14260 [Meridianimarinicoccus roseus]|uniref:Uncharacterized protein n=2 Tax=Meridianimarinicoccus roseus TaxID=2072018 RepID=A0A2V2LHT8_9RHOB|nr:hypothetical protein DKT77_14260 [Meridianimarinicoccus roseus]